MLVELDLFSGRLNPRWELDDNARRALLQLEAALAPAMRSTPKPPDLGYRGFHYGENNEGRHVFLGVLRAKGQALADPSFAIERFLLNHIPAEFSSLKATITPLLAP